MDEWTNSILMNKISGDIHSYRSWMDDLSEWNKHAEVDCQETIEQWFDGLIEVEMVDGEKKSE